MPCYPLSENTYTVDDSKVFVPFNYKTDKLEERPHGSLLVDIVPFLVITGNDIVVIDPGLGYLLDNGEYHILANLRYLGYNAEDVTKVFLSHLHKDHAGGVAYNENGRWQLMFPKADYYVQEGECNYMLSKESRSYEKDRMLFLIEHPQCYKLNGDGNINDHIQYFVTGGHTPYHQAFILKDNNQTFFYGGDVLPQSKQMTRRFIAKYDYDGRLCTDLRAQWAKEGVDNNYIYLFFHDATIPMGTVSSESGAFKVNAVI